MRTLKVRQKSNIYFARTYRRLQPNNKQRWLFLLGFVLPCIFLFLFFYTEISYVLAEFVKQALLAVIPEDSLDIVYGEFLPYFGGIYYLQIPSKMPTHLEIVINLFVTLLLLLIIFLSFRNSKGVKPLSIYFSFILFIHLISCLFFIFAKDFFPYSATGYSELYIEQQVSIWLSFIILSGLVLGFLGYGSIIGRLIAFLGTMIYSFVFGGLRFLIFMFIIAKGSSLYMATLFFSLGPLFDFLYLVSFYGIYINSKIRYFNQGEGRLKWKWL